MIRLVQAFRKRLPRRRRRFWRYVSPRRRGVGVLILALLLTCVYGYWRLTHNNRIRIQAAEYLRDITGASVSVDGAEFQLFGGIELAGVRITVPGGSPDRPFLVARKIVLRHRPWALFATGRVQPTDILCLEPVITLEQDIRAGTNTAQELFSLSRRRQSSSQQNVPDNLPTIRVRGGLLRIVRKDGRLRRVVSEKPLSLSGAPGRGATYIVSFEEQSEGKKPAITGVLNLDLATGVYRVEGQVPELAGISDALPPEYSRWLRRYRIKGGLKLIGQATPAAKQDKVTVQLENFSLKLPDAEGGLDLLGVTGTLVFEKDKVTLEKAITGRISQAGGAKLEMWGQYEGYRPDSPFEIHIRVWNMAIPAPGATSGDLARALERLRKEYQPSGRMNLQVTFKRDGRGNVTFEGIAELLGMGLLCEVFPCRLENVRGRIAFRQGHFETYEEEELVGRYGKARVTIKGVFPTDNYAVHDLTVTGRDVVFDRPLRDALPKNYARIWDALSPAGSASGTVRLFKRTEGGRQEIQVRIVADGKAAICYEGFPYPVENLFGEVNIADNVVRIESLHGFRDPMQCRIKGTLSGLDTDQPVVDLTIRGRNLPLDRLLLDALDEPTRAMLASLHPKGLADDIRVEVTQSRGRPLTYNIQALMKNASFRFDAFPYEVSGVGGELTIVPERVLIRDLRGVHRKTPITINGQVFLQQEELGVDLRVEAKDVRLDRELFEALPSEFKDVWRTLRPGGRADVAVSVQYKVPSQAEKVDYQLDINATDAEMTYQDFPYTLRGLSGHIVATPTRIVLDGLKAREGKMSAALNGFILLGDRRDKAVLSIHAKNVPIDKALIGALPKEMSSLTKRFRYGGTLDIDLKKLSLVRAHAVPVSQPATAATTRPSRTGSQFEWSIERVKPDDKDEPPSSIVLKDAIIDFGFGDKTLSGRISGTASRTAKGLGIDAKVTFGEIVVGQRKLCDVSGRMVKSPAGKIIQIKDLIGKVHKGKFAGFAQIELTDPLQYGVRLSVADVDVNDLFNAGVKDPSLRTNVRGLLDGNLQLIASTGRKPTRQALGKLWVSKGSLYKMPVFLGLLNVIYLTLPGESAFTDAFVTYRLRDEKLIFDEIHLDGPKLSAVGSGTMEMKTERLKISFLTGPPGKLPRIASLEEMLHGIVREIVEIQVTGTLNKPRMRPVPLRTLDDAIRRLLAPGQTGR